MLSFTIEALLGKGLFGNSPCAGKNNCNGDCSHVEAANTKISSLESEINALKLRLHAYELVGTAPINCHPSNDYHQPFNSLPSWCLDDLITHPCNKIFNNAASSPTMSQFQAQLLDGKTEVYSYRPSISSLNTITANSNPNVDNGFISPYPSSSNDFIVSKKRRSHEIDSYSAYETPRGKYRKLEYMDSQEISVPSVILSDSDIKNRESDDQDEEDVEESWIVQERPDPSLAISEKMDEEDADEDDDQDEQDEEEEMLDAYSHGQSWKVLRWLSNQYSHDVERSKFQLSTILNDTLDDPFESPVKMKGTKRGFNEFDEDEEIDHKRKHMRMWT